MDHPNDAIAQAVAQLVAQLANAIVLIFGTLIVGGSALIVSVANAWFTRKKNAAIDLIDKKLDNNTKLTVETKSGIEGVKSDVKDAKDTAVDAAQEAQIAKRQALLSNQAATRLSRDTVTGVGEVAASVGEVKELLKDTREALNGRTTELINAARAEGLLEGTKIHDGITTRIERLEGGHEILVQGQTEVIKSIDRLMGEVREIGKDVKSQSKY